MLAIFYNININMNIIKAINIIYKVINIIFALFFTVIIISILSNTEYFMINDTAFFRILSMVTLLSLWLPVFIRINIFIISICFLIFIIYFILYIAHPLL